MTGISTGRKNAVITAAMLCASTLAAILCCGCDGYGLGEAFVKERTFTVSFDANGGAPAQIDPVKVIQDEEWRSSSHWPSMSKAGYTFVGWFDGDGVQYTSDTKITKDVTLTARWTVTVYALTVQVGSLGGGTVTPARSTVDVGTQVSISAIPKTGYRFVNWTGGAVDDSTSATTTVTVNSSMTLIAKFHWDQYTGPTTKIGAQTWMAENLNIETDSSWCYTGSYSFTAGCATHGRLYAWNAAMTACPSGWHLPTREEWNTLIEHAGGASTAGKKLKSKSGWSSSNSGTDDYKFSALPGGYRYNEYGGSRFNDAGSSGYWWSATGNRSGSTYVYRISNSSDRAEEVERSSNVANGYGYSVRCVQDSGWTPPPALTYTLTVNANNSAYGTVTPKSQSNISAGTPIDISATATSGGVVYTFVNWTVTRGNATLADPSSEKTKVTLSSDATVTANFQQGYTLWVNVTPEGAGRVYTDGSWWDSDSTNYTAAATAVVRATPSLGYTFVNWTGAVANFANDVTNVEVNSNMTVTANFQPKVMGKYSGSTVKLGGLTWMAENLDLETDSSWCYRNSPDSCDKYGRLYNWEAAKVACQGVAGWRLPSVEDWDRLLDEVGGIKEGSTYHYAGTALKSMSGWNDYDGASGNGADAHGFSALPGGYRSYSNSNNFYEAGRQGRWWSATRYEYDNSYMLGTLMRNDGNYVVNGSGNHMRDGYSVRCVKDD